MELLILATVLFLALLLIPLGLPGTWVMVGAGVMYNSVIGAERVGWVTMLATAILAFTGEGIEMVLAGRYARKYGGSRRAGWGAILGGMAGAFAGIPVPIVGPMIGAFGGAFVGALVAEYTRGREAGAATRVATGALLGRVAGVAVKVAIGCAISAWLLLAAWQ